MSLKFLNVSLIMCESADYETRTIKSYFNGIQFDNGSQKNFCIVSVINSMGLYSAEHEYVLHYFIQSKKSGSFIKVEELSITFPRSSEKEGGNGSTSFSEMIFSKINGISFPEAGDYQIKVYKQDRVDGPIFQEDKIPPEDKLVAIYEFEVK
jgi:hypothetical protein